MTPLDIILTAFAVWFVAHIVTSTAGPRNVFRALRRHFPPRDTGGIGDALDCKFCAATWIGLAFVLLWAAWPGVTGWVVLWLGMCGIAMVADSASGWRFDE